MSLAKKIGEAMAITIAEEALRLNRENPRLNPRAIIKTVKDELYFYLNGKEAPKPAPKTNPNTEPVISDRDTGDEHQPKMTTKAKAISRKGSGFYIVDMSQIFKKSN